MVRELRNTMSELWTRRRFVGEAAGAAAALAVAAQGVRATAVAPRGVGLQGRFLTHVSVVRVNQIEVTPTRSIGLDESGDNSPALIRARREAFAPLIVPALWTPKPP